MATPAQPPLPAGLVQPNAELALKVAVTTEGIRVVWVTDDVATATKRINECEDRLISFTQVRGMKPYPFATRPDNIASVRDVT